MILIVRPRGRGNWAILTMAIEGKRASPILIRPGQTFWLGGVEYRICKVVP